MEPSLRAEAERVCGDASRVSLTSRQQRMLQLVNQRSQKSLL